MFSPSISAMTKILALEEILLYSRHKAHSWTSCNDWI